MGFTLPSFWTSQCLAAEQWPSLQRWHLLEWAWQKIWPPCNQGSFLLRSSIYTTSLSHFIFNNPVYAVSWGHVTCQVSEEMEQGFEPRPPRSMPLIIVLSPQQHNTCTCFPGRPATALWFPLFKMKEHNRENIKAKARTVFPKSHEVACRGDKGKIANPPSAWSSDRRFSACVGSRLWMLHWRAC